MSNSRDENKKEKILNQSAEKIRAEPDDPMYLHPIKFLSRKLVKQPIKFNGVTDPLIRDHLDEPKHSP